jgi:hypothetical protein
MKEHFLSVFIAVFVSVMLASCNSGNNGVNVLNDSIAGAVFTDKNAVAAISFKEEFHDFGQLTSGEIVSYAFKFRNTGKSVLVISNVATSCGCTVTDYPKQPVKPGEEAIIDVKFDTKGKRGLQTKSITVIANTEPANTTLRIQASIVEPEDI